MCYRCGDRNLEKAGESETGLIRSCVCSLEGSLLVGPEKAGQASPTNRKDVPHGSEWVLTIT